MRTLVTLLTFCLCSCTAFAQSFPLQCTAATGVPPIVRAEGLAELVGDLVIACLDGTNSQPVLANVQVSFNTSVTNKLASAGSTDTDAWLLVNEPLSPSPGNNAFRGKLASRNSIVFASVPIPRNGTLRLTNVRLDASALGASSTLVPTQLVALVSITGSTLVPIDNPVQTIGFTLPGLRTQIGAVSVGTTPSAQILPVVFHEAFQTSFRRKIDPGQSGSQPGQVWNSESGYLHPNLLAPTSAADTGTRLRVRVPVPTGVRVYAPTRANGTDTSAADGADSARLLSADGSGTGGTEIQGSSLFGGTYQELIPASGLSTATWEVFSSSPAQLERLAFNLVIQNATPVQTEAITRSLILSFAPASSVAAASSTSPVPRFAIAPGFVVSPDEFSLPAGAGGSVFSLQLLEGQAWSVSSNVSWITFTSPASGTGSAGVAFSVTANPSSFARTGSITVNGRTLVVKQAGSTCRYTISPGTWQSPSAGDTGRIAITAPAGCGWAAVADSNWITITTPLNDIGSGEIQFSVAPNSGASVRVGTITVARQTFTVSQSASGAYRCETSGGVPPVVRADGLAERMGDILMSCVGTPPTGGADILVTLNTAVAGRLTAAGADDTDAFLLINEPSAPTIGTTAVRGLIAGPNSIRFPNVPLPSGTGGTATMRIVNIRANTIGTIRPDTATVGQIVAVVQTRSARPVAITSAGEFAVGGSPVVAFVSPAVKMIPGGVAEGPTPQTRKLGIVIGEGFSNAFAPKEIPGDTTSTPGESYLTESGYRHPSLGLQTGTATNGTRLRLRLPVPPGVRVFAPVMPSNSTGAQLVSANDLGAGGTAAAGTPMFGGTGFAGNYQQLTVANGFAVATWEILHTADLETRATQVEQFSFDLIVEGTDAQVAAISLNASATLGPVSTLSGPDATAALPRFLDPIGDRPTVDIKVVRAGQFIGQRPSSAKVTSHAAVGSNYVFSYNVVNDSSEPAPGVVVRGNLPPGFNYSSCTRSDGGACTISQNEAKAIIDLAAGGSVEVDMVASGTGVQEGTVLENTISAGNNQFEAEVEDNQTSSSFVIGICSVQLSSNATSVPQQGGTGSFTFGSCTAWTASSAVDWITLSQPTNGSGAGSVSFSVAPNPGSTPRVGTILAAGLAHTVTQAAACFFNLSSTSATVPAAGQLVTVNLTSGASCEWTASSNAPWAQVYPLNGSGARTVEVNVFPTFSTIGRSATITIAGRQFTIIQSAAAGTSDERFIRLVYFNYFGRMPSDEEVAFQVTNALNKGQSRAQIATNFAASDEFSLGGRFVAGLYVGLLNRDPEYSGWLFQRSALSRGLTSSTGLVGNFLGSAEYAAKFGNPTPAEYVRLLYRYVLLREANQAEVTFQVGAALTPDTVVSRVGLARNMLGSSEFINGRGARLSAFLLYATILQRDGSPEEREFRAGQIGGGMPVSDLIAAFLNTPEFAVLLQ